jgi:hypothetical protein
VLRRQAHCLFCLSVTPPQAVVHLAGDETGGEGYEQAEDAPLTSSASSPSCSSIASRSLGAEKDARSRCSCSAE